MEDIIDIIVTETTNLIEIISQPTDEIIDVNIIDNREDITLNVTPSLVEININSLTGNFGVNWGEIAGTLSNQTDLQNALNLKADLVDGKVPSSQLPSYVDDIVEVATYSALPTTGEMGKIYVVLDTNLIYRWSGSAYIEIKDSSAVWGAITGTLSSQTDLQNALNAKFDDPTGDTTQYIAGDGSLITFPIAGQAGTLVREVRNTTGATLTKGTIVYISGATGNKPTVSKAIATGDSTSAQTFGMCQADISNNSNGYVVCVGDITGLDTSAVSEGVQLYLSSTTAGTYTTTKQVAPAHLVYIGVVTRSHPTQGQIEVKIQNGYELDEIHDVAISSVANNQGIFWESSTSLWKNKSIATVLGYTPQAQLNGTGFIKASGTTISYDNSTYLTTSSAASTYLAKTGGTLTGSLNGTTAVFSGAVWGQTGYFSNTTADNALAIFQSNASYHAVTITNSGVGGSALYVSGGSSFFGTVNITGVLTAQAGLANGSGQSFTLPSTTGTLALTSQLSSYLPLSGGTLTGALSGTSANFSGLTVENNQNGSTWVISKNTNSGAGAAAGFLMTNNTGDLGAISLLSSGNSPANGLFIRTLSTNSLILGTNSAANLTITSSGNVGIGTTSPFSQGSGATTMELAGNTYGQFFVSANSASIRGVVMARASTLNDVYIASITNSPLLFGTNDTERMRITSSGNVGIGTTSPGVSLEVNGLIRSVPTYNNTTATLPNLVVSAGGTFERSTTSSKRHKENITLWNGGGLNTILALQPKEFTYKSDYYNYPDRKFLGLIAEEVAEISSYLADFSNEDGTGQVENVRYANIVVPLIKAVQEQQVQIQELKQQLANK